MGYRRPVPARASASVEGDGHEVVFTVDDSGPGVPEDARKDIFTPFFTTKESGTGLGLAVAHTIVGLHGGTLTVDAAPPPYGGARFQLSLPAD